MKLTRFFAVICTALACILSSSCTKGEAASAYKSSMWSGNYTIQVLNNDTNDMEECTASVFLQFSSSGHECTVETGIIGMYAINKSTYDVKWYSTDTFALCETNGGQTIQYYSGTIKGGKMSFEFLSCDKVERTVELEAVHLE